MLTIHFKQGVFIASAILCVVSCFGARFPVLAQDSDSTKSSLSALLKERRDVLKTRVEMFEKLVSVARSTPEALIAARDDMLNAEYELTNSSDERIGVLKQKLENAKQLELVMEQRKRDARGTEAEILMAKAGRLAIEIELLKESERKGKSQ